MHSPWAYTKNEQQKRKENLEEYKKLKDKVTFIPREIKNDKEAVEKLKKEKAVLNHVGFGYGHTKYKILSNPENIPISQLALYADHGNLCFGYRVENDMIIVYTD